MDLPANSTVTDWKRLPRMLLIGHTLSVASNACPLALRMKSSHSKRMSAKEIRSVDGATSKRMSFASSKVAALGPIYTSCVAILSVRVGGT